MLGFMRLRLRTISGEQRTENEKGRMENGERKMGKRD
jgi:hypothetical protein